MKKHSAAIALLLMFAYAGYSQGKGSRPRFSSVYTNLTTDCRNFDGEGGTDGYSVCRGPGGYRIRVYFSAASSHYNAELAKDESSNFPIAMLPVDFNDRKTRIEWRMADGKPFAVIMRVPAYADPVNPGEYYGPVNGHRLLIRGLKGIELDASVDAKERNANAKARTIADSHYSPPGWTIN